MKQTRGVGRAGGVGHRKRVGAIAEEAAEVVGQGIQRLGENLRRKGKEKGSRYVGWCANVVVCA